MGHLIEDDVLKRSDFNDEGSLFAMRKRLELHPLNNRAYMPERIVIPASASLHKYIAIENRELNNPVSVTISCPGGRIVLICTTSHGGPAQEIDITRFLGSKVN